MGHTIPTLKSDSPIITGPNINSLTLPSAQRIFRLVSLNEVEFPQAIPLLYARRIQTRVNSLCLTPTWNLQHARS